MRELCEFIAGKIKTPRRKADLFLVSSALDSGAHAQGLSQGNILQAFMREHDKRPLKRLQDIVLEERPSKVEVDLASRNVTVILGTDFEHWGELHTLTERFDSAAAVDIVLLVPARGAAAISQASLSQFTTELAIRAQAFGFVGTMRIAAQCDSSDLGLARLERPHFATSLGKFLDGLTPDEEPRVAVLVLSCRSVADIGTAPMFTVLTRTQGKRMETLREVFLCLSAQTMVDFEHVVIAHNAKPDAVDQIRALIEDQSDRMRGRIRFEEVIGGTRTTPLNAGFATARGKYVVVLDDDDIVFANWLETFRAIAREKPGSLLRAVAVRQEFTWAQVEGKRAARAVSAMHRDYAARFDYFDHLEVSQTPPVSIAFPRYLFASHGLRFDETLTTTEDWDYIMRGAAYVGVGSAEEITCIYRWWVDAENSRTVHSQSEWHDNHHLIQDKINASVNLLEAGSINRFRDVSAKMNEYLRWANKLHHDLNDIQRATDASDIEQAKQKIALLSQSVHGELSTILKDGPIDAMPLSPPKRDLLPPPRLSPLQKLLAGPATITRMRAQQRRETIEASGIFDAQWYLSTYPDVAQQNMDPLTHFVQFGSRELRSPSAQFNARSYYAAYNDLRDHEIEPVFHFVLHGKREGRRYQGHP